MAPALLWFLSGSLLLLLALSGLDNDGLLLLAGLCGLLLSLVLIALPSLAGVGQLLLFLTLVVVSYAGLRRWARQQRERPVPPSAAAERAEPTPETSAKRTCLTPARPAAGAAMPRVDSHHYPLVLALRTQAQEALRYWTEVCEHYEAHRGNATPQDEARSGEIIDLITRQQRHQVNAPTQ